jgi:phosphocarrier protein FPr
MVGIVLVSHSRALALAAQELVRSMTGPALPLAVAAGAGENHAELGTDAVEISEAISAVKGPDGVLVLMDMGSAILSSETALDLLDESICAQVRFCPASFVEGAVAAGVTANLGASLDDVYREALAGLHQKESALSPPAAAPVEESARKKEAPAVTSQSIRLKVRNPHGLHARPAALLIREAGAFHSDITIRNLTNQRGPASAKSLSRLASLEILQDNEIEVSASGDDKAQALEKIRQLVETGLGDELPAASRGPSPTTTKQIDATNISPTQPVPISGGIAIGPVFYAKRMEAEVPNEKIEDVAAETKRLEEIVAQVQKNLEARRDQMARTVGAAQAGIYDAQILALRDPDLVGCALNLIRTEKLGAAPAWNRANREVVARYKSLSDPYLRERAADLEDVGRQVLEELGVEISQDIRLTDPAILITDDLAPGQISGLPRKLVLGVVLLDGGPTAHSSILLKAIGIPAVVQARTALGGADLGRLTLLAFDGSTGKIWPDPDRNKLAQLKQDQAAETARAEEEKKSSAEPGATLDGKRVEVFANVGRAAEAESVLERGAEGIGLLRTEFLFLDRASAPTEDEQVEILRTIAVAMKGRPVIVRTLDAGGDKQLPYLPPISEANPFLGVRALRLCFKYEDLFTAQLRAILRAGHGQDVRIMFPMIASLADLERAQAILNQVHLDLESRGVPHLWPVPTGIMIEIPSSALMAGQLAEKADFFSIGTNDLTQYTLAADRGNPELAPYQDALDPAVLRLIDLVVKGAKTRERLVAVCGEAASDELAARIFVGLGVDELSMAGAKIPRLKAALKKHKMSELQKLAANALACASAAEVRKLSA